MTVEPGINAPLAKNSTLVIVPVHAEAVAVRCSELPSGWLAMAAAGEVRLTPALIEEAHPFTIQFPDASAVMLEYEVQTDPHSFGLMLMVPDPAPQFTVQAPADDSLMLEYVQLLLDAPWVSVP